MFVYQQLKMPQVQLQVYSLAAWGNSFFNSLQSVWRGMWVTTETGLLLNLKNKMLGLFVWTESSLYVINLGQESGPLGDVCPQTSAYCAWFILVDILGPRMHCPCPESVLKGLF